MVCEIGGDEGDHLKDGEEVEVFIYRELGRSRDL
jgi:hypothetical protein